MDKKTFYLIKMENTGEKMNSNIYFSILDKIPTRVL